jgi:hypothetical protein
MLRKFGLVETNAKAVHPGRRYGRLKVLATGQRPGTYRYYAVCQCDCESRPKAVRFDGLLAGTTLSCGCLQSDRSTTHGLTKSPHYSRWRHMMDRCYNPQCARYADYGGRGIRVCKRWHDIRKFVVELPPGFHKGLEIDRIDNDGNYRPGNVRWAVRKVNAGNRRSARMLKFKGITQSATGWAQEYGIPLSIITARIDNFGWSVERAITEPVADVVENMRRAQTIRWIGHVKRYRPPPRVLKRFPFRGKDRTIREMSEITGISVDLLRKRICERKWSVERATATPA